MHRDEVLSLLNGWLEPECFRDVAENGLQVEGKDDITGEPMTSWHRFDLIDSSYAMALMSDRTPAWRAVYAEILDELPASDYRDALARYISELVDREL